MGLRLEAPTPYTKANFPGYGRYRVLDAAGFGSENKGEDGRVEHGGRERERDGRSQWESGKRRN